MPIEVVWLRILEEAVYTISTPQNCQAILIRTNIRKLDALIRKDLYLKFSSAVKIAQSIHDRL